MKKLFSLLLAICLIAGLLPVVASAAGATAKASFINSENGEMVTLEVTDGGEAKYLVTEDGYAHAETATASNYNIKFQFVDGKPTIFLKGANLKAPNKKMCISISSSAGGPEEYVLYTETESFLESNGSYNVYVSGTHIRVTGPGKLNLTVVDSTAIGIYDSTAATAGTKYDITLEDADIYLSTTRLTEGLLVCGFGNHARDITISGGKLDAEVSDSGVVYCVPAGGNSNLYIKNSPEITVEHTGGKTGSFARVENAIVIENGNFLIRHGGTSAFYAGKEFKIYGGTIDCVGGPFSYSPTTVKIDFGDYAENCTVVVCNSVDGKGAVQYDPEKSAQQDRYVYFKITPGVSYEVAVKNGTTDLSVAEAGETVTITARIAPEGKVFDKWEVNNGDITLTDPAAMTTTFVMPKENVKVTATYKDDPTQVEDEPEASTPEESTPEVSTPDVSTPDESTPDASTPDTDNDEGNKKPATSNKGNGGFIALFIIMIVVLVLAIAAVVVFTIITMKKMGIQLFKAKAPAEAIEAAAEETEEATEETAEDAE